MINYRNTPHSATGLAPAEIMFGRKLLTKLPKFAVNKKDTFIRQRDLKYKLKHRSYADTRRHTKATPMQAGDRILVQNTHPHKLDSAFDPSPARVVERKGSMVTVKYKGRSVNRDISRVKPVLGSRSSELISQPIEPTNVQPTNSTQHRPVRNRRPPTKFKDFTST